MTDPQLQREYVLVERRPDGESGTTYMPTALQASDSYVRQRLAATGRDDVVNGFSCLQRTS